MHAPKLINQIAQTIDSRAEFNSSDFVDAYVVSSLVRGDFVLGKSDVDLLFIFNDNTTLDKMKTTTNEVITKLKNSLNLKAVNNNHSSEVDILYIYQKDVPQTIAQSLNSPFPLFSIFGFDLKKYHQLIIGNDILRKFTPANPKLLIPKFIIKWINKSKNNPENTTLYAGQILRALAIGAGATSLVKKHINQTIVASPLPQFVKDYAISHYNYCYNNTNQNNLQQSSLTLQSKQFIAQIENTLQPQKKAPKPRLSFLT